MKRILMLVVLAFAGLNAFAQPTCCVPPPATGTLAMLTTSAFIAAHELPEPFQFQSDRGSMITFNTLDGETGNAYYVPSPQATDKVLVIFHEWWGLNDYIKREAVRWQDSLGNVDVYAIDLYDGKVAATREEASALSSGLDKRRTDNIIKGAMAKVGRNSRIATLGWCLGGTYAFTAAVEAGQQASGCVMYYGFPEKDAKRIKPLKTDVLYNWGTQDNFITKEVIAPFEQEVKGTGHSFELYSYDAVHAFANPSNPKYDAAAAALAEARTIPFLKAHLGL